jgi:hypothetical protein
MSLQGSFIEYAILQFTRSHLKIRILIQSQGGSEFQPAGILKYVEDMKRGTNVEIGPKDYFEIASRHFSVFAGGH